MGDIGGAIVSFVFLFIFGTAAIAVLYECLFGSRDRGSTPASEPKDKRLCCSNCGGYNIQVSVSTVSEVVGSTREVREKNKITREANHIGRGIMNVMTLGMWSITPKRSDYKEIEKVQTRTIQYKTAVCQTCGHSWDL